MNNLKKEWMLIYMCRNGIATFAITLCAFLVELTNYYQSTLGYAMQRIFTNNIYTLMYFFMIWILNYLLFEIFEISIDTCKELYKDKIPTIKGIGLVTITSIIAPVVLTIAVYFLVQSLLFKTSFCLLLVFMALRSCKEYYKKTKADSKESTSVK